MIMVDWGSGRAWRRGSCRGRTGWGRSGLRLVVGERGSNVSTASQLESGFVNADITGIIGSLDSDSVESDSSYWAVTLDASDSFSIVHITGPVRSGGVSFQDDLEGTLHWNPDVSESGRSDTVVFSTDQVGEHTGASGVLLRDAVPVSQSDGAVRVDVVVRNIVGSDVAVVIVNSHFHAVSKVHVLSCVLPGDGHASRVHSRVFFLVDVSGCVLVAEPAVLVTVTGVAFYSGLLADFGEDLVQAESGYYKGKSHVGGVQKN